MDTDFTNPSKQPAPCAFFDVDSRVFDESSQRLIIGPRALPIQAQLVRIFQVAQDKGIPVIATNCVQTPSILPALRRSDLFIRLEGDQQPALRAAKARTSIFIERRSCGDGDANVAACVWDVFQTNPHAAECIRRVNIQTWAVFGISLEFCLRGACAGLCRLGMKVSVLSDAVVPSPRTNGATLQDGLDLLRRAGARIITTDAFLQEIAHA